MKPTLHHSQNPLDPHELSAMARDLVKVWVPSQLSKNEPWLKVMTVGDAINLAKEGNVAFLWEAPAMESNPIVACHLARVKKRFYSGPVVMATRKGFPYLNAFNYR